MTIEYKGHTFRSGRWLKARCTTVRSRSHEYYDYCVRNDDCAVDFFMIRGVRVALHELYSRGGCMGFDSGAEHYPPCINCYTDKVGSYLEGTMCELSDDGEKLRVWEEIQ